LVSDVYDQIEIIKQMGAKIEWIGKHKIKIDPQNLDSEKIPYALLKKCGFPHY